MNTSCTQLLLKGVIENIKINFVLRGISFRRLSNVTSFHISVVAFQVKITALTKVFSSLKKGETVKWHRRQAEQMWFEIY
jgi:hypothetical protein